MGKIENESKINENCYIDLELLKNAKGEMIKRRMENELE